MCILFSNASVGLQFVLFFLTKPTYLYCTGTPELFMCGGASVDSCSRSILLNWRSSDNTVLLLCLLSEKHITGRKEFPLYELLFQVLSTSGQRAEQQPMQTSWSSYCQLSKQWQHTA